MNPQIIHKSVTKARKEYYDDGWDYIQEWEGDLPPNKKLTFTEKKMIVTYKRKKGIYGHKILKGETYIRQFNTYDGTPYVWRTKKVFYDFICKYDLFPDL